MKRFLWHNVNRLQGHLTDTKQNSTSVTQQNKQSIRYRQWQSCNAVQGHLRSPISVSIENQYATSY